MITKLVLLDTGVLGMASHPKLNSEIKIWLLRLVHAGNIVCIPEICDYEVRRELLRAGNWSGILRLDNLKSDLEYLPITTEIMLRAAEFWADARKSGMPTADDKALGADVILAAHADVLHQSSRLKTVIATTNVKHLARFVKADTWQNIR